MHALYVHLQKFRITHLASHHLIINPNHISKSSFFKDIFQLIITIIIQCQNFETLIFNYVSNL